MLNNHSHIPDNPLDCPNYMCVGQMIQFTCICATYFVGCSIIHWNKMIDIAYLQQDPST